MQPEGDEDGYRAALGAVVAALAATPAARQSQHRQQPGVQLQPTVATSNPKLTSTNLLTELDQATQQVIGAHQLCLRLGKLLAAPSAGLRALLPSWHVCCATS